MYDVLLFSLGIVLYLFGVALAKHNRPNTIALTAIEGRGRLRC
jgi:hypothetical protein